MKLASVMQFWYGRVPKELTLFFLEWTGFSFLGDRGPELSSIDPV